MAKHGTFRLRFPSLVLAVLLGVLVAANAAAEQVTLRWRTCCRQEDRVELFQRWAEEFEAENPDIRIEWYDPPGGLNQVKVEIAGGVGPDIMMQGAGIYSMLDVLMPLNEMIDRNPELQDIFPAVLDQFTWKGEVYALPYGGNAHALMYNQHLFDSAGLSYPDPEWTWDEALDIARRLTRDVTGDDVPDVWGINLTAAGIRDAVLSFGGPVLADDGVTVQVNNPANEAALGLFSELMGRGLDAHPLPGMVGASNSLQHFFSGQLGILGQGVFSIPGLRDNAEFPWDAAVYPALVVDGVRYQNAYTSAEGWAMLRSTPHPEEAERFLRFLMAPERLAELGAAGIVIPPYRGRPIEAFLASPPPPRNLAAFTEALQFGQRLYMLSPVGSQVRDQIAGLIGQVFNFSITPAGALEQIDRVLNAAVRESQNR